MTPADAISGHDLSVHDDPAAGRFEARVAGSPAGYAYFRADDKRVVFTHTEVEPAWEGKGIGSALARGALDQVRPTGRRVVPQCPFIAGYIRRHREYVDLVDSGSLHLVDSGVEPAN